MSIKIITDSCSDLPEELLKEYNICIVPLEVRFKDECYIDGINISKEQFYTKMRGSDELPKTASPSPQQFIKEFNGAENDIIVLTVSSGLSSTYNNAVLAKNIYEQENTGKAIHIIDSLGASIGEGIIALKAAQMALENIPVREIIDSIGEHVKNTRIFFVLDTLENIVKGGRIGKVAGKIASLLSIKLIMKSDGNGIVDLVERVRGTKKAMKRLLDIIGEAGVDIENRVLGIAHANCYDKAMEFKNMVEEKYNFKNIIICTMGSSIGTYAGEDGILIAF